jgi:hypothetical protein
MGACGYILSCLALNGLASGIPGPWVICPVLLTPECGYWGPGHVLSWASRRSLEQADKWQNPVRLWLFRWDKGTCSECA